MWEAFMTLVVNVVGELTLGWLTGSDAATKKVKETEAQAKAAEARLAKAQQPQAKKKPSTSTLPDSELPEEDEG